MLRAWIDDKVLPVFEDRILSVDTAVAQRCARLHVPDPGAERDALIAATAPVSRLTVVTATWRISGRWASIFSIRGRDDG